MKKGSKKAGSVISDEEWDKQFDEAAIKALNAPDNRVKVRVNTFIDADIYDALHEEAERTAAGGAGEVLAVVVQQAACMRVMTTVRPWRSHACFARAFWVTSGFSEICS
jgi:hypothetical protein